MAQPQQDIDDFLFGDRPVDLEPAPTKKELEAAAEWFASFVMKNPEVLNRS